jgi:hypothetical protein
MQNPIVKIMNFLVKSTVLFTVMYLTLCFIMWDFLALSDLSVRVLIVVAMIISLPDSKKDAFFK